MTIMNQVRSRHSLTAVISFVCVSLALLWPPLVNGEPFFMPDTTTYMRGADAGIYKLTGMRTEWTDEFLARYGSEPASSAPTAEASVPPGSQEPPVTLSGRSVYYGLLLYMGRLLGSFWLVAIGQAVLTATCIILTIRKLRGEIGARFRVREAAIWGVGLAVLTPVGYFAGYLMPDLFAALGLLALAHLISFWRRDSTKLRAFWLFVLAAALLVHSANILVLAALAALAMAVYALRLLPLGRTQFIAIAGAFLVAFAGQAVFSWAVVRTTGAPPVRPPFMSARMIDDGPGYRYLAENCPASGFLMCRVLNLESKNSDVLLWSLDPSQGLFMALPREEQRRVAAEDRRLALSIIANRPIEVLGSWISGFSRQLTHFGLTEFNYHKSNRDRYRDKLPPQVFDHTRRSAAYTQTMPVRFIELISIPVIILSVLAILWKLRSFERRDGRLSRVAVFLLVILGGIMLNAAVCGILSSPKGRYQMRIVWVLPLVAIGVIDPRRRAVGSIPISDPPRMTGSHQNA